MSVRVCLPVQDAPQGGMFSFFRNFRTFLDAQDIPVVTDVEGDYDVLVANSWVVRDEIVARAKRRSPRLKVLHRIDGSAVAYGRDAASDVRQALVNLLADVTVFQSAYGRAVTRRDGRIIGDDGPVIHNPVDTTRFCPDGERLALPGAIRLVHVAYSTNPRKGAATVIEIARRRRDVTFLMVGRHDAAPVLDNLIVVGHADWGRLPAVLRSCTALLMMSENETCPNVVLEGLASGLPVLYKASGGTAELVGDCGVAVDTATFDAGLASVMARHSALSAAARARAVGDFGLDVIFPRYLKAVECAVRRPLPRAIDYARVLTRLRASPPTVARWIASRMLRPRPARPPAGARP